MQITYRNQPLQLKFDTGALEIIDRRLGIEMEGAHVGQGLNFFASGLQNGQYTAIAAAVIGGTDHLQRKNGSAYVPTTNDEIDEVMDSIAEDMGFEAFGQQAVDELGKRPRTRSLLPKELQEEYKEQAKQRLQGVPNQQPEQETPATNQAPTY